MQLDIYKNGAVIESIPLNVGVEYLVGRGTDNDIVLDTQSVSRRHAKIEITDSRLVIITDLKSTNGTFLAGKRVAVSDWDDFNSVLFIGDFQLHLRLPENEKVEATQEKHLHDEASHHGNLMVCQGTDNTNTNAKIKKNNNKISPYIAMTVALVIPFAVFLLRDQLTLDSRITGIVKNESDKVERIWHVNKIQVIKSELAKAEEYFLADNFKLTQGIIDDVLTKDSGNMDAIALRDKLAGKKRSLEDEKRLTKSQAGKTQEQKRQKKNEQLISDYISKIQIDVAKKDYSSCIKTGQKILRIDPGSQQALKAIELCNSAIGFALNKKKARETEENKVTAKLEELLAKGNTAAEKRKYNAALKMWINGIKLDPEKKYEVTRKIDKQIKKAKDNRSQVVAGFTKRARKEKEGGNNLQALHYYELAYKTTPSNKEVKNRYYSQLSANHQLATNLYHEAVAYASLDNLEEANRALEHAKKLAVGDKNLSSRIKDKIDVLQKK